MDRTDSVFLIVCAAILGFSVTYYLDPPAPRYYPIEHTWRMANEKGVPSMGWYGRSAWGLGVGMAVGIVSGVALPCVFGRRTPSERKALPNWLIRVLSVVVVAALLCLAAQILNHEFHKWGTWEAWSSPGQSASS